MYNPNRVKTRLGVIRYSLSVISFERSTGKITSRLQKRYKNFGAQQKHRLGINQDCCLLRLLWIFGVRFQVSGTMFSCNGPALRERFISYAIPFRFLLNP